MTISGTTIQRRAQANVNELHLVEFDERGHAMADWLMPELKARLRGSRFALVHVDEEHGTQTQSAYVFGPMGLTSFTQVSNRTATLSPSGFSPSQDNPRLRAAMRTVPGKLAVTRFLARLDQKILRTLRACHALDSKLYNWCLIDPERRCAALASYPAFANRFRENAIEMAIALSGSLENALASVLCHSNAVIRHVGRLSPAALDSGDQDKLMDLLDLLPPSHWPSSRTLARRMLKLADHCSTLGGNYSMTALPTRIFKQTVLARDVPWDSIEWEKFSFSDGMDAIKSLIRALLIPSTLVAWSKRMIPELKIDVIGRIWSRHNSTAASRQVRQNVILEIIGQGGLSGFERFSRAWHDRVGHLSRDGEDLPDKIRLPALLEQPVTLGGLTYVPLLTPGALKSEHKRMKHCINTYAEGCARGADFAFHVNGDGIDCTMTIARDVRGRIAKDQARGFKNEVADKYEQAADALLAYLIENKLTEPKGGEEAQEALAKREGPSVWARNPAIAAKMADESFQYWLAILPKRLRAATPEGLIAGPFRDAMSVAYSKARKKQAELPFAA